MNLCPIDWKLNTKKGFFFQYFFFGGGGGFNPFSIPPPAPIFSSCFVLIEKRTILHGNESPVSVDNCNPGFVLFMEKISIMFLQTRIYINYKLRSQCVCTPESIIRADLILLHPSTSILYTKKL